MLQNILQKLRPKFYYYSPLFFQSLGKQPPTQSTDNQNPTHITEGYTKFFR